MAQLILRPISDVSNLNFTPSSGSYIYATINEASADDSTLYSSSMGSGGTFSVKVNSLTTAQIKKIKTIDSLVVYSRMYASGSGGGATFGITAPISSTGSTSLSNSYSTSALSIAINTKPDSFDLNSITLYCYVDSSGTSNDGKTILSFYITQMYVVVNYTEKKVEMRIKINGVWKEANGAYVKINGAWKEADSLFSKIGTWKSG